jgi:hypothetical protein
MPFPQRRGFHSSLPLKGIEVFIRANPWLGIEEFVLPPSLYSPLPAHPSLLLKGIEVFIRVHPPRYAPPSVFICGEN